MRTLILVFALFASAPALAADDLRCTVTLLQPMLSQNPGPLYIAPESSFVVFDYDSMTEKNVRLAIREVIPSEDEEFTSQYSFDLAKEGEDASLTVEFSKKDSDGNRLEGKQFSYYMRLARGGAAWTFGHGDYGAQNTVSLNITEKLEGYAVMTCIPK